VLRSNSAIISPAKFEPLWKRVSLVIWYRWWHGRCDPISIARTSLKVPKLVVNMQGTDFAAIANISLDSWEMCRATCLFRSSTPIIFRLAVSDPGSLVDHYTTVGHIRHRIFSLLVSLSRRLSTQAIVICYVAVKFGGPGTSFEAVTVEYPGSTPKKSVPKDDIAHEFEIKDVYEAGCTYWHAQDLEITHIWVDMSTDDWPEASRGKLSSFLNVLLSSRATGSARTVLKLGGSRVSAQV
jgi:hypothetical protein